MKLIKFSLSAFFCCLLCAWVLVSCGSGSTSKKDIPDVSDIEIDLDLVRYDEMLFDIDTTQIEVGVKNLFEKYPKFSELYFNQLTNFYNKDQDTFHLTVQNFLQDKNMRKLQEDIEEEFGDLKNSKKNLIESLKLLKHYFPNHPMPIFYTLNSEFGFQSFIFSESNRDGIGIGLDLFLGEDFNYKQIDPTNPSFSKYLVRTYNEEHIVSKTMGVVAKDILGDKVGKRFIDQMLHNGKRLYLLGKLLPEVNDTLIVEQSNVHWEWLKNNELEIWSYFLEKNLMYETNFFEINKYLNPAPHSPGMPPEAPGKTANFIGLQIVKSFMRRNPDMNLQDLVAFEDAQKLLEMAKYKPKRR